MPGKGIAGSARRSAIAIRAIWPFGVLLVWSCSGASKFSSGDGDAGESSVGGTSAGSAGDQSGGGGTVATGGGGGTVATGGMSGTSSGGNGGDPTGGTGGTDPAGGRGGTSGASGSSSGGSGLGGSTGSGGSGGQTGGSAGSGGATNEDCPLRVPSGMCEPNGLVCRYSAANQCLCTSPQPGTACIADARCTLLLDRPARIIIDGGVPDGGAIPVATTTCTCIGGTWSCGFP
jgi:hypothetical protein